MACGELLLDLQQQALLFAIAGVGGGALRAEQVVVALAVELVALAAAMAAVSALLLARRSGALPVGARDSAGESAALAPLAGPEGAEGKGADERAYMAL